MLIDFSVENFLSFDGSQCLSMEAGKYRQKMDHLLRDRRGNLLKFMAIYGANAAGKSALVNAMRFSQRVIKGAIPFNIANQYCRLNPNNKTKSTTFNYTLKIENKIYKYGFEIFLYKASIKKEWLLVVENEKENQIYIRNPEEGTYDIHPGLNKKSLTDIKFIAENIKSNERELFLTELNHNKDGLYQNNKNLEFFQKIYDWFVNRLIINFPNKAISPALFLDANKMNEANKIFQTMNLGFDKLDLVQSSEDEVQKSMPTELFNKIKEDLLKRTLESNKQGELGGGAMLRSNNEFFILRIYPDSLNLDVQKIKTIHNKCNETFSVSEESDGTRKIIDLVEIIISARLGENKVYIIDEINRCLHPILTYKFVEEYLSSIKDKEIQLIITTHEIQLMQNDLLRQDEICFVSKDDSASPSKITLLSNFDQRNDKRLIRAYLNGDFGGIPNIKITKKNEGDTLT